jgi:hypothetical protein
MPRLGLCETWTVDRHPLASVGTLVLGLRCSWCPAHGADPEAARPVRSAASQSPARRSTKTFSRLKSTHSDRP